MKLNTVKRLVQEDYPQKYKDLLPGLFQVLNQYLEQVYFLANKQINFADNFQAMDVEVEVIAPVNGTKVANTLGRNLRGSIVLRVDNLTDSSKTLTTAPFIEFSNGSSGDIIINNITGLTTGSKYRIRTVFFV